MNKKLFFALFIFFGLAIGLVTQWPDGKFRVIGCDVGQGDAILLTRGFTQILVDGGPNSRATNCLSSHMPFWDKTIEVVVATHPDKDHISGLINVIESYKVMSFVSINKANSSAEFENLQKLVLEKKTAVHIAKTGDSIIAGKIRLNILWPEKDGGEKLVWREKIDNDGFSTRSSTTLGARSKNNEESTNDFSVVAKASFGKFDVLLTGDIGEDVEKRLVNDFDLSGIEVLKVSHHGSKYSTSREFVEEIRPKMALIGVGKNRWGHPTEEVLGRLSEFGIRVLRTDFLGDIELVSDGEEFWESNEQ